MIKRRSTTKLLEYVALGMSNDEIAQQFGCSHHTIESDLRILYNAYDCRQVHHILKRVELVAIAFRKGIIT